MKRRMQSVVVHQIPVGPMANFSYLIADPALKVAAYIDPGWEVEKVLGVAQRAEWTIEKILLTHTHFDHIQELRTAWEQTQAPIFVHALEAVNIETAGAEANGTKLEGAICSIASEERISIGGLEVQCLHTPGHTPGMICFYIAPHCITGDMLFVDGCGRVDLPGSEPEKMFSSLQRLSKLPDDTIIYPGHNYGPSPTSTLGEQKKTNPYLIAAMKGRDFFFERRGF